MLFNIFLFCVFFGSSADGVYVDKCYGKSFSLPYDYAPVLYKGPVYFTPRNGGPRKLLVDNGQAKDPTVGVSMSSVKIKDLRQSGTFSGQSEVEDVILQVLDCARRVSKMYRHAYTIDLPPTTEFLEYTLDYDSDETKLLWNRSDPRSFNGERGKMTTLGWDFITLTQEDNGYYSLRGKDKTLLDRIMLTVEEDTRYYELNVGDRLLISNPYTGDPWTVTFTPTWDDEKQIVMEGGYLAMQENWEIFSRRIQLRRKEIEIDPVEITDSGTFEYRDPHGNLAQVVTVKVIFEPVPTYVYASIAGGIVLAVILCCCCVRKCCCKKGSSKRDESAPAAVYYHDQDQPAGQSYSAAPAPDYSYQPVNPPASRQPAATSAGPSVSAPGGQGDAPAPSLGSDCLSSEPPPMFELKGLTFPSAPPLGSESTISDVYTSDKLNFL